MVDAYLAKAAVDRGEKVLFFDDNLLNVVSMQQHIGIKGCWVKGKGIQAEGDVAQWVAQYGKPDYMIDAFDLNAEVVKF